jgi:hypothetical protein
MLGCTCEKEQGMISTKDRATFIGFMRQEGWISVKNFKKQHLGLYENLRNGIIAASHYHGYDISVKKIDIISNSEAYRKELEALPPSARMKISINRKASPFTLAALEKERRWVFHMLQRGYLLANVEILFEGTVEALQNKDIDVLRTPFTSPDWNPIIEAYFQDKETPNNCGLQIN